ADRLVGQVRAEGGGPVVLDVPDRHPARVEADGHVIEPAQAPLPLRDQARGERPSAIPRDLQLDRPELGLHRLRRAPVAGVGVLRRLAGALLIAQVAGQLGLQTPLERCLDQGGHEPPVTGQLDLASGDRLEQRSQLPAGVQLRDQTQPRARTALTMAGTTPPSPVSPPWPASICSNRASSCPQALSCSTRSWPEGPSSCCCFSFVMVMIVPFLSVRLTQTI